MCDFLANLIFVLIYAGWDAFTISSTILSGATVLTMFSWVLMFEGPAVGYVDAESIEMYFTACQVMKWIWWVGYWVVPALITVDAIILET